MKFAGSAHCSNSASAYYLVRYNKKFTFVLILHFICWQCIEFNNTRYTSAHITHLSFFFKKTPWCCIVNEFVHKLYAAVPDGPKSMSYVSVFWEHLVPSKMSCTDTYVVFRDKLRPKCLLISWKLVCSHSLNSDYGMNCERRNQFTEV